MRTPFCFTAAIAAVLTLLLHGGTAVFFALWLAGFCLAWLVLA